MNDMNKRTFLSLLLCVCSLSFLHAERVDMQQAGADIQGRKLNTALINSTIDRLNANGGGTLFFPAGTYLTGSIHMKSNITFHVDGTGEISSCGEKECSATIGIQAVDGRINQCRV